MYIHMYIYIRCVHIKKNKYIYIYTYIYIYMYMPLSVSLSLAKTVLHFSFPAAEPGCKDQVPIPGLARRVAEDTINKVLHKAEQLYLRLPQLYIYIICICINM